MGEKRRDWFPKRFAVGCAGPAIVACGSLLFLGSGSRFEFACVCALVAAVMIMGEIFFGRRGIELHEDGLTLVGWLGRRHVPWSRIRQFHDRVRSATFTADGKRVKLDEFTVGWGELCGEIERH